MSEEQSSVLSAAESLRGLREGAARVAKAPRLTIASGADAVAFLGRILTGPVVSTAVGGGCHALLLNLKGHVVADLRVLRGSDCCWLQSESAHSPLQALSRYAVMDDVTFVEADMPGVGLFGPESAAQVARLGLTDLIELAGAGVWQHQWLANEQSFAVRARRFGAEGMWIYGAAALRLAGVATADPAALEYARVAAGEPQVVDESGGEISENCLPMEVGLMDAIDHTKGCYLGQEPIVRIRDRGQANWRLCRLTVDGGIPHAKDRLETDARAKSGTVTSVGVVADHPTVALALVHATVPDGSRVRIVRDNDGQTAPIAQAEVSAAAGGPA